MRVVAQVWRDGAEPLQVYLDTSSPLQPATDGMATFQTLLGFGSHQQSATCENHDAVRARPTPVRDPSMRKAPDRSGGNRISVTGVHCSAGRYDVSRRWLSGRRRDNSRR